MNFQEWLEEQYAQWEREQPARQSYYSFARYLDVPHTLLTQWASGISQPGDEDLAKLAALLGSEVYAVVGLGPPHAQTLSLEGLPKALRARLEQAIAETTREIQARRLSPDSSEAKILTVKLFEKWGFRISG